MIVPDDPEQEKSWPSGEAGPREDAIGPGGRSALLSSGALAVACAVLGMETSRRALWGDVNDLTKVEHPVEPAHSAGADGLSGRHGAGHQRHGLPGDVPQSAGHALHAGRFQRGSLGAAVIHGGGPSPCRLSSVSLSALLGAGLSIVLVYG